MCLCFNPFASSFLVSPSLPCFATMSPFLIQFTPFCHSFTSFCLSFTPFCPSFAPFCPLPPCLGMALIVCIFSVPDEQLLSTLSLGFLTSFPWVLPSPAAAAIAVSLFISLSLFVCLESAAQLPARRIKNLPYYFIVTLNRESSGVACPCFFPICEDKTSSFSHLPTLVKV